MTKEETLKYALTAALNEQFKTAKAKGFTERDNDLFAQGLLAGILLATGTLASMDGDITPSLMGEAARSLAIDMGFEQFK